MAIKKKYADYVDIFNQYKCDDYVDVKSNLKKLSYVEIAFNVILVLTILTFIVSMTPGHQDKILLLIPVGIAIFLFLLPLNIARKDYISKLDDELFNKFLIKRLKIYYSIDELKDYSYTKIEHIVSSENSGLRNQVVINISFEAYIKGAEGIIIVDQNSISHTSGNIGKRGGKVSTTIIHSAEGILIKNIKKNNIDSDTKVDKNDIVYWFDLKKKGIINKEEFEGQKKRILTLNQLE